MVQLSKRFTYPEAAEKAGLPLTALEAEIAAGNLKAFFDDEKSEYVIEEVELTNFITNKSSKNLFYEEYENSEEPNINAASSAMGLRKILTVESVSELKIQQQILTARIDTLERLFSEFIEAEKEPPTLVLDEAWKLSSPVDKSIDENSPENQTSVEKDIKEEILDDTSLVSLKDNNAVKEEILSGKTDKDSAANDEALVTRDLPDKTTEDSAKIEELKIKDSSLLKDKLKDVRENEKVDDISKDEIVDDISKDEIEGNLRDMTVPIDTMLKDYERRLIEAKKTATQMWH